MFCGKPLKAEAVRYFPYTFFADEGWTHLRIHLLRERYSDCPTIAVKAQVFRAKELEGGFETEEKHFLCYEELLGALRAHNFEKGHPFTVDDGSEEATKQIERELERALDKLEEHFATLKDGVPIPAHLIGRCIRSACHSRL